VRSPEATKRLSHGTDQYPTQCRGKKQKNKKGRRCVRNKKTEHGKPKEEYKRRPSWI
jgi:hypothetical protein